MTALLAWMLMPTVRERVRHDVARAVHASRQLAGAAGSAGLQRGVGLQARSRHIATELHAAIASLQLPWRWLVLAAALLVAVPVIAIAWRHWDAFDGYDHTASRAADPQVTALLQGEQLVPPVPLPPALFTTRDVEAARPLARSASRQWELLDADFRQRLLVVFKLMREQHGVEMVLLEGYRSVERQNQLAALGPNVTHAAGGASYHQYGLAADAAFLIDGRIVISERDPQAARGYELYGALAHSVGLTWGGSWRSLRDLGHVELRRPGVLTATPGHAAAR